LDSDFCLVELLDKELVSRSASQSWLAELGTFRASFETPSGESEMRCSSGVGLGRAVTASPVRGWPRTSRDLAGCLGYPIPTHAQNISVVMGHIAKKFK
jgi:hypothetical protein